MTDETKSAWVERVLQVPPRGSSGGTPLAIWRDAKDGLDQQIRALQSAFADIDHPLAQAIADRGLSGLSDRIQVGLQAALFDYQAADAAGRAAAGKKVQDATAKLRAFLASDPALPLLEKNPMGLPVDIRATLGQAADRIDAATAG